MQSAAHVEMSDADCELYSGFASVLGALYRDSVPPASRTTNCNITETTNK